jgi:hypothetical protein
MSRSDVGNTYPNEDENLNSGDPNERELIEKFDDFLKIVKKTPSEHVKKRICMYIEEETKQLRLLVDNVIIIKKYYEYEEKDVTHTKNLSEGKYCHIYFLNKKLYYVINTSNTVEEKEGENKKELNIIDRDDIDIVNFALKDFIIKSQKDGKLQKRGGKKASSTYKLNGDKVSLLINKKKLHRSVYVKGNGKAKYCKINNEFVLLSKLKNKIIE